MGIPQETLKGPRPNSLLNYILYDATQYSTHYSDQIIGEAKNFLKSKAA